MQSARKTTLLFAAISRAIDSANERRPQTLAAHITHLQYQFSPTVSCDRGQRNAGWGAGWYALYCSRKSLELPLMPSRYFWEANSAEGADWTKVHVALFINLGRLSRSFNSSGMGKVNNVVSNLIPMWFNQMSQLWNESTKHDSVLFQKGLQRTQCSYLDVNLFAAFAFTAIHIT